MTQITLSFDNGPDPEVTPRVLDILRAYDVKTSFFAVGQRLLVDGALDASARAVAEGHWLGNHTFSHSPALGLRPSPTLAEDEIGRTQEMLAGLATPGKLFRPSGGGGNLDKRLLTQSCYEFLISGKYTCVLWHSVPGDLQGLDWVTRAFEDMQQRDWTLVVLHDIQNGAIRRLDEFLDRVRMERIEVRQDFPPDCVPIVRGEPIRTMDPFISDGRTF
jgi:peptidoglycan/xylan/chitin deacetylase (PgdA/CDA1 family)